MVGNEVKRLINLPAASSVSADLLKYKAVGGFRPSLFYEQREKGLRSKLEAVLRGAEPCKMTTHYELLPVRGGQISSIPTTLPLHSEGWIQDDIWV
ncbi:hypothetical protein QQP08_019347 [Theobroma cacao]|nr:hypothetical protein QQP08_019347 [Theobroma cacao]